MELSFRHYLNSIWSHVLDRCYLESCECYRNYGGRGIGVYEPWREVSHSKLSPGFIRFATYILEELGERPEGHTLDRIDNDGDYEPGNLRWADRLTQNDNRRTYDHSTRKSDFPGVTWSGYSYQGVVRLKGKPYRTKRHKDPRVVYEWVKELRGSLGLETLPPRSSTKQVES